MLKTYLYTIQLFWNILLNTEWYLICNFSIQLSVLVYTIFYKYHFDFFFK